MKKSVLGVALTALAGAACAQSSVTLFGIVDTTLERGNASGPGSTALTQLTSGGNSTSRLGFRGNEDLGGGMAASFWLEGQLGTDSGVAGGAIPAGNQAITTPANNGVNFNRRSTVSLSGHFGELRLGRDYTPSFWNLSVFDPFTTVGVGANIMELGAATFGLVPGGTSGVLVRASNSIGYFLPASLGGVYGQADYWLGENGSANAAGHHSGTGYGARLGYASGPLNVAAAWSRTSYAQTATSGGFRTWNIGGQWDFHVVRLMAQYGRDRRDSTIALEGKSWLLAAVVPVGAGEIKASYGAYSVDAHGPGVAEPAAHKLAIGYVYNLSKRTALYATVARVRNSGGGTMALGGATIGSGVVDSRSAGYDLGIRHTF